MRAVSIDHLAAQSMQDGVQGEGANYIRFPVTLSCDPNENNWPAWWQSSDQNPDKDRGPNQGDDPVHGNVNSALDILDDIKIQQQALGPSGLIPDVDFLPNYNHCAKKMTSVVWAKEIANFIATVNGGNTSYDLTHPIYFEIGNEENFAKNYQGYGGSAKGYAAIFAAAANAIATAVARAKPRASDYHILTGGVLSPVADQGCKNTKFKDNIDDINMAIESVKSKPLHAHLGVAVHPYSYVTFDYAANDRMQQHPLRVDWPNYRAVNPHVDGRCFDLAHMINLWLHYKSLKGLPLVFSEINVVPPAASRADQCYTASTRPSCEGAYMVDLMTWLGAHPYPGARSYASAHNSPLRVFWYRPDDTIEKESAPFASEGFYNLQYDQPKFDAHQVTITICSLLPSVAGLHTLSNDFFRLRHNVCYNGPVTKPSIALTPTQGRPGSTTVVHGIHFPATGIVQISWYACHPYSATACKGVAHEQLTRGAHKAKADGSFDIRVSIPLGRQIGTFSIVVTYSKGIVSTSGRVGAASQATETSAGEVAAPFQLTPAPNMSPTSSVYVPANQEPPGVDVGFDIASGETVTTHATGKARYTTDLQPGCKGTPTTDPNGDRQVGNEPCTPAQLFDPTSVLSSAPIGSLIGCVGTHGRCTTSYFLIGSSKVLAPSAHGRLYLLYNDAPSTYGNNTGGYKVEVVTSQP